MNLNHMALAVADVPAVAAFYRTLGLTTIVDGEEYARLRLPEGTSTLSLIRTPDVAAGNTVTLYLETADVGSAVAHLKALGTSFLHDPVLQPWGWEEARLKDPAGHTVCIFRAGEKRFVI